MRSALLCLLLAGCRLYDPHPLDCRITCGIEGACPVDTTCREGFCRIAGAKGGCECRAGEERPCGVDQGVCRPGVQRCVGTEWGACEGPLTPTDEACNGLDDDCDGAVDEDIPLPPTCAKDFGVCFDARQRCVAGAWLACDDQSYGPDFEADETRCDGADNDCDGLVDSRAVVELTQGARAPWFLLTTRTGFALVNATDAGVELRWLSKTLEPRGLAFAAPSDPQFLATSRGDTVILAARTDAGVALERFEPDGGVELSMVASWLDVDALELSVDVAAARVGGTVQLLSWSDAGQPVVLGPDTDGTLRLSQTGETLAWSGGLTRTVDLALLKAGSPGSLLALLDLEAGLLAGVPAPQPAEPTFVPDLIAGDPARALTPFPVPSLTGVQATEHLGRVLLVGLEGTNLWLVDERGTQRRSIPSGLESVRVSPSHQPFAAVAWEHAGTVWAVRRCAP